MSTYAVVLSAIAFFSFASQVHAVPTATGVAVDYHDVADGLAEVLKVTPHDIFDLLSTTDYSAVNLGPWTTPFGVATNVSNAWSSAAKSVFLDELKADFSESLETALNDVETDAPTPVKAAIIAARASGVSGPRSSPAAAAKLGKDSPAAQAEVTRAINAAKAARDSSNRRKLLQCNTGTRLSCNVCAGICSLAWVSASGVCSSVALGAEVASDGLLTPAVYVALGSCLGLATSAYAACIVKCVG